MNILPIQEQQVDLVDLVARGRLKEINRIYQLCREAHYNEYKNFWYNPDTSVRSVDVINAELAKMDELAPLGSAQYFGRAWSLVQFLLASEANSGLADSEKLTTDQYMPPLPIVDTEQGGKRVQTV